MADARDYDFQIGDLCFRGATSDRFPYVRATAPFRKEQFDTSPTVGDQSLTGWWTRGQLSFHKGAGVKYYEVLQGDEILNRFRRSESINCRKAGEVTLGAATYDAIDFTTVSGGIQDVLGCPNFPSLCWIEDGADVRRQVYGNDPSDPLNAPATITGMTGNPHLLASSDRYYFISTWGSTDRIYRVGNQHVESATAVEIYTNTSGPMELGYAKGRLWGVDQNGNVYALSADPASTPVDITTETPVFTIDGYSVGWNVQICGSAGGVYVGHQTRIYEVSIEESGALPTLTAGVIAAELPDGETISAMSYSLGRLVITTARGVRVAHVDSLGALALGPRFIEGTSEFELHRSAVIGSRVLTMLRDIEDETDSNYRLIDIDLEVEVAPLQYAYTTSSTGYTFNDAGWSDHGAAVVSMGGVSVVVAGTDFTSGAFAQWREHVNAERIETGTLTTGQHRFGTLESKHFSGVSVRCGGPGGTIDVVSILPSGTESLLSTIDVSESTGVDVSLVLDSPIEAVGLKFVLNRATSDPTAGPTLLGYQLKALPAPERQRILKWPLLLHDVLQLRRGAQVGRQGKALADLQALEALESSQAVVDFTDHRTNETGTAYVDSVEFQSDTPSNRNGANFGGISYITLRVLS